MPILLTSTQASTTSQGIFLQVNKMGMINEPFLIQTCYTLLIYPYEKTLYLFTNIQVQTDNSGRIFIIKTLCVWSRRQLFPLAVLTIPAIPAQFDFAHIPPGI